MFMTSNQIKKQGNTKSKINQITCAHGWWAVRWWNREVQITCAGGCGGHKWRSSDICCTSQASLLSRTENSSSYHLPPYLRLFIFTLVWFFSGRGKGLGYTGSIWVKERPTFEALNPFQVALLRLPPKCLSGSPGLAIFKPGRSCAQLRFTFQLSSFCTSVTPIAYLHPLSGQLCGTAVMALPRLLDLLQRKSGLNTSLSFGTIWDTWVLKAIFAQEKKRKKWGWGWGNFGYIHLVQET